MPASDDDVVLVTVTTGALGSALLARLVETESVARVYAFNRPSRSPKTVLERQREALKSRGYNPDIVERRKWFLLKVSSLEWGSESVLLSKTRFVCLFYYQIWVLTLIATDPTLCHPYYS